MFEEQNSLIQPGQAILWEFFANEFTGFALEALQVQRGRINNHPVTHKANLELE